MNLLYSDFNYFSSDRNETLNITKAIKKMKCYANNVESDIIIKHLILFIIIQLILDTLYKYIFRKTIVNHFIHLWCCPQIYKMQMQLF